MNNERYFERHMRELATDEFFRFKIADTHGLSFMVVIHRNKSLIDLYEEVDLRINGVAGGSYFRLGGIRDNPDTELEFGRNTLHGVIQGMVEEGKAVQVDDQPSVIELHLLHGNDFD